MITLKSILSIPENKRPDIKVGDVMISAKYLAIMKTDMQADKALLQMIQKRVGKVYVCDTDGKLLGVVSKTDIIEIAGERQRYLQTVKKIG